MICLDTNVVIAFLGGKPDHLGERLKREMLEGDVALPSIALFELQYGIFKSLRRQRNADQLTLFLQLPVTILSFGPEDAEQSGEIRATLDRAGTPIGPYDVLIAAQARRRGATLVTANTREFARVPGLKTEDWASA